MLKFLRSLFTTPTLDRRTEGYTFAKGQIAAGQRQAMENFVEGAKLFGAYDQFDAGIEDALREVRDA